jgi:hypothetical protein
MQVHFTNAIAPGRNLPGESQVWFPYTYLKLAGAGSQLTLLDQYVDSSPISVRSTLLRGTHFTAGGLAVHAGFTSVAGFQSLLLPVNEQLIFGATFTHALGHDSQIGVTGYHIRRDVTPLDRQTAQTVGTVFFNRHTPVGSCRPETIHCGGSDVALEVGLSKGIGGAFSVSHHTDRDEIHFTGRYRPLHYAASVTDKLNGLQSDARWDHVWNERVGSTLGGSDNHILTGADSQTVAVGTGNLRYKVGRGFSLSPGISASTFTDSRALVAEIRRLEVPVILSYDDARFGVGAQYGYSQTSHAVSVGHRYQGSLRWSDTHFQFNANAGLDTQAVGIDTVFSAFPTLNAALAQLGLGTTTSAEQLVTLLNDRAFLSSLGIAPNASLQLVPRNWRGGVNVGWQGARQLVQLDSTYNLNSFFTQRNTTILQTVRYSRGLSKATELVTSFTLLESVAPIRQLNPIAAVGVRHQFGDSPFPHRHRQNGTISGTVRLQDASGNRAMRGVEITLDGDRRTTSDVRGVYRFSSVPHGVHVVQIRFESSRSFWYTTPSRVSTEADSTVDFGIIYPSAQIKGYALNDAGVGLPDIGILVEGPQGTLNVTTDQAGTFAVPVAQAGAYVVRANVETIPDGYALEDLGPVAVSVRDGELKKVSITVSAIRALTGSVQRYDAAREMYAPVAGVTVQLRELTRQTTTNTSGNYMFRDMPPGTFTIVVDGRRSGEVQMSMAPQVLRHDVKLNVRTLADPAK